MYPGTARWQSLHGPVVPSALPIIDQGVRPMCEAGLPEREVLEDAGVRVTPARRIAAVIQ